MPPQLRPVDAGAPPAPGIPLPSERLERVAACDLCGGRDLRPVATYPDYLLFRGEYRLVGCSCGLRFIDPRPSAADIGLFYPDDYEAHQDQPFSLARWQRIAGAGEPARLGPLDRLWVYLNQQVSWYAIPPPLGDRRVVDVGCGSGKLLDRLKALGWETHGVESSDAAARRARAKGHDVAIGRAEDACFPPGQFDLVYIWHVLEHTHEPRRVLESCYRYLRPGGQLWLCVPNFHSLQARLFGRWWWSTDAPRHLYQFTRGTIRDYLGRVGFRDVRITTRTGSTSWVRGVRHTVNGLLGTRWRTDPPALMALGEVPVILSALCRFFGVGSELRVVATK